MTASPRPCILLIEDNEDHAALVGRSFARGGGAAPARLAVCTSIAAAEDFLRETTPSVILCDYKLVDGNGLDLLHRHISGNPAAPPFVLLTSQGDETVAVAAMKAGATDYLVKSQSMYLTLPELCRSLSREHRQRLDRLHLADDVRLSNQILENLSEGVVVSRKSDRAIITANPMFDRMFGYQGGELVGRHVSTLYAAPDGFSPPQSADAIVAELDTRGAWSGELLNVRKNGEPIWCMIRVTSFQHQVHGELWISVHADITERKRAEEDLSWELLMKSALAALAKSLISPELDIADVSRMALEYAKQLTGSVQGFVGEVDAGNGEMIALEVPPGHPQIERVLSVPVHYGDELVGQITVANGPREYTDRHREAVARVAELFALAVHRRRAEARRLSLETQLNQSQKMESIGLLAGGIAHDFNNLLQVIAGYATMLQMKRELDWRARDHVAQIITAAERAAQLTSGLLAFSRKQPQTLREENLTEVVRQTEKFVVRIIGEDIQFRSSATHPTLPVMVDRGQMEQVLINLATNARDAMPQGGSLLVETGRDEIVDVIGNDLRPGPYACVSVSDTGVGMDPGTRAKIFEPFFTTKEVGKGTGLGMAIVYGIVKQHNGAITVYSEPGHGTTFRLYLPLVGEGKDFSADVPPPPPPSGGTETILLAEDEEMVRRLVGEVLQKFGYQVIEAVDGEDVVQRFAEHAGPIDLIIMDMIMPKKNGSEAYREISRMKPGVKVLFSSGYTADFIKDRGAAEEGIELVMKPVQPLALLRKVREMLDAG